MLAGDAAAEESTKTVTMNRSRFWWLLGMPKLLSGEDETG
jgi:hypothetical protein